MTCRVDAYGVREREDIFSQVEQTEENVWVTAPPNISNMKLKIATASFKSSEIPGAQNLSQGVRNRLATRKGNQILMIRQR